MTNTTDTLFTTKRQDRSLIIIQEAVDDKGVWRPIEYWVHSTCGNSYLQALQLSSGMYVTIPIRQYKGEYKTKFRLKMRNDKQIIFLDTFEGSILKSQFGKRWVANGYY